MEEGKCPKCGHYNLEYEALEIEGNSVYYPWTCQTVILQEKNGMI